MLGKKSYTANCLIPTGSKLSIVGQKKTSSVSYMGVNNCILFVVSNTYVRTFQKKGDVIDEISRAPLRRRLAIYTQIAQPNSKM